MTREEEIRQEMSKIAGTHPDWSKNDCMRMGFQEGAKWADETMIEKACKWLLKGGYFVNNTETINDFKKAMEL
jgi:hypothetical protein